MKAKIILAVVWLLSRLPLSIIRFMGLLIGTILYYVPNSQRQIGAINLQLCYPALSLKNRNQLLKKALQNSITTLMEFPKVWLGDTVKWRKKIKHDSSTQLIDDKLALGKGLIVAVPHLGNWETGIDLLMQKAPVTGLYRPPRQQVLEKIMTQGRNKTGANFVPTNQSGIKQIFQALRRGEIIIILPDQQPKKKEKSAALFAPFFNHPALTMTLLSRIANKTKAPMVFGTVRRLPFLKGYESYWLDAPKGVHSSDLLTSVTAINKGIEQTILPYPEQYLWTYKRFEAQPDGKNPYKRND